jgi:hypothetical protein
VILFVFAPDTAALCATLDTLAKEIVEPTRGP